MKKLFTMLLCGAMFVSFTACEKNEPSDGTTTGTHAGHEYVDLGLPSGTLWATCNIGAKSPEECGGYFAWAETKSKEYFWGSYIYYDDNNKFTKYCTRSHEGIVDNKIILEPIDDAAHVNWGGDWRMPTYAELNELCTECTWTWATINGMNGCTVTSKKDTNISIFLPATGAYSDQPELQGVGEFGGYWSSSLHETEPDRAYDIFFYSETHDMSYSFRTYGQCVRPVCSPQ